MSIAVDRIRQLPTYNDSDIVWIEWHKALKKVFGRKKANALYSLNWDAQNGYKSDANTSKLRDYLDDNGLKISGGVLGDTKDFFGGIGDYFGDFFTVGKYLGIGLASVLAISVAGLIFQIAFNKKTRGEAIRVGSAIATRGATEVGK